MNSSEMYDIYQYYLSKTDSATEQNFLREKMDELMKESLGNVASEDSSDT